MIVADLPPEMQDRIVCSVIASRAYDIPADILLAIAEIEGGFPDQLVANKNGTYDVGYMQFNSAYLKSLSVKYDQNFTELVNQSGCYSFFLAAWRLKGHLTNDKGSIWQRAANYHSKTEQFNLRYQKKLINSAHQWAEWLRNYKGEQR